MKKLMLALVAGTVIVAACGGGNQPQTPAAGAKTDAEKAEVAFLQEMVPHHTQAVEMAKLCTASASHAELKELCGRIITAQEKEIGEMKSWAKTWYGSDIAQTTSTGSHGGGHPGDGMQSESDVKMLSGLSGNDFDRRFVDMMTGHHEGAIDTATKVKGTAPHAEVRTLAGNIISSQASEVKQMKAWKEAWFS